MKCYLFLLFVCLFSRMTIAGKRNKTDFDIESRTKSHSAAKKIIFDFPLPADDETILSRIMQLPKPMNKIILGNIENLSDEARNNIFEFYDACFRTKQFLQRIQEYQMSIVTDIISWKISENKDEKNVKLNVNLKSKIAFCMQAAENHANEYNREKNVNQEFSVQLIGDVTTDCRTSFTKLLSLPADIGNTKRLSDIKEVIHSLPFTSCVRILMIKSALSLFDNSLLPMLSRFVLSIEQQAISAIREFVENTNVDAALTLNESVRTLFFRFMQWNEILFIDAALPIKEDVYRFQPNNTNLPAFDNLFSKIPLGEKHYFQEKWSFLMRVLNFPVDVHPVILGNIHLVPKLTIVKMCQVFSFYKKEHYPRNSFEKLQNKIVYNILKWRYKWKTLFGEKESFENLNIDVIDLECKINCDDTVPDYNKIGNIIKCLNTDRDIQKREKVQELKFENNYTESYLEEVITRLPTEICAWTSVVQIIIKKLSDDNKRRQFETRLIENILYFALGDKNMTETLMNLFNIFHDLTSVFQEQFETDFFVSQSKKPTGSLSDSDSGSFSRGVTGHARYRRPKKLLKQESTVTSVSMQRDTTDRVQAAELLPLKEKISATPSVEYDSMAMDETIDLELAL